MSKTSKASSKLKRLQAKRARKAVNTAKYAALRQAGQNSKSKRFIRNKVSLVAVFDHADGRCGNFACNKCFPK